MSKRKSKKSNRFTEISIPIGYLNSLSDGNDEARKLAKALLKAADQLDGGR